MDGVLVDSEPLYHLSINQVLANHGYSLSEEANREVLGTTVEYTWAWLKKHFGLPSALDSWIAEYDAVVLKNLRKKVTPSPGVYKLLGGLKERGIQLGLASSSQGNWVEAIMSALGIEGRFDVVVSGEMVSEGKPHPEIFLLATQMLAVQPEECLVIEDSPHGIKAAKRAGMIVVAVLTPYTRDLDLSEADQVLDSLQQFDYEILDSA